MNKRIEELAKQAGFYADKYGQCKSQFGNVLVDGYDFIDLEKFAKLIVQSIADIDFRLELGVTSDQRMDIGNLIKNHFGDEQ